MLVRLSTKIVLALIVAATVPLLAVGYWLSLLEQETLRDNARELYLSVAQTVAARLTYQTDRAADALTATATVLSRRSLSRDDKIQLASDLLAAGDFTAIGVYDTSGRFIDAFVKQHASSPLPVVLPPSLPEGLRAALRLGQTATVPLSPLTSGGLPSIGVAVRWEAEDEVRGTLLMLVGGEKLCRFTGEVSQQTFAGKPDQVYLVDDSLRLVAFYDTLRAAAYPSLAGTGIFEKTPSDQGLSLPLKSFGLSKEYTAATGQEMLGAAISLPSLGMAVVIEQPQRVAYRNISEMRRNTVLWTLVSGAVAAVISFFLASQLTKPVRELVSAAGKLAVQDFTVRLDALRRDEFGMLFTVYNRVAVELQHYQKLNVNQIVSERNKLLSIVKQAGDGILIVDPSRRVSVANDRITRWFNLNAVAAATDGRHADGQPADGNAAADQAVQEKAVQEKLVEGKSVDDSSVNFQSVEGGLMEGQSIHNTAFDPSLAAAIEEAFSSPLPVVAVDLRLQIAGEVRETVLRGVFVKVWRESEVIAIAGILRDVSKEVEIDRLKTELVAVVAHELRAPIANIGGFSSLIADDPKTPPAQREFAEIISRESARLSGVITKFLDINRLESGRMELMRVPFRVDELVRTVIHLNTSLAKKKRITIDLSQVLSTSTPVIGDPDAIGQAILNLFSNAVKYSGEGTRVSVIMLEEKEEIVVSVVDEGYGISQASQKKLFAKFFRAGDDERVQAEVGTGLGLALTKEIIERHGGVIDAKSELGKGSTFRFTLPK